MDSEWTQWLTHTPEWGGGMTVRSCPSSVIHTHVSEGSLQCSCANKKCDKCRKWTLRLQLPHKTNKQLEKQWQLLLQVISYYLRWVCPCKSVSLLQFTVQCSTSELSVYMECQLSTSSTTSGTVIVSHTHTCTHHSSTQRPHHTEHNTHLIKEIIISIIYNWLTLLQECSDSCPVQCAVW